MQKNFVQRWVGGTLIGGLLAFLIVLASLGLWENIAPAAAKQFPIIAAQQSGISDVLFALIVLIALLLIGATMGLAQWYVALRGLIRGRVWLLTSAITAVTAVAGIWIGTQFAPSMFQVQQGTLSGMDDRLFLSDGWAVSVIIWGLSFGVTASLPLWIVLRRSFRRVDQWLAVTVGGSVGMLFLLAGFVYVVKGAVLTEGFSCCILPLMFSALTGAALQNVLKHTKSEEASV